MPTCVPRSKQPDDHDESNRYGDTPAGKQSMKTLTSQIKEMAIKASGAYRSCSPCARPTMMTSQQQQLERSNDAESCSSASAFSESHAHRRRNGSSGRVWGKEMEARLKAISIGSGGGGEAPASGRRCEPVVLTEEIEPKEWVAQVEPGVLITFVALPRGGNDLKRIRFSREMFSKWKAQRWWQENFDKVMELYNVRRLNRQAFPLPTPPGDQLAPNSRSSKIESLEYIPLPPTLRKERQPYTVQLEHQGSTSMTSNTDSIGLAVTPKLLSISGTKTETSSLGASINANWSRELDSNEELSISKMGDVDNEWVEQDEPGVYITIKVLPSGSRELKRVRFSREKFGEVHARLWWEENRARIQKQYL